MHFPLRLLSQAPLTGEHWKINGISRAIHQATTKANVQWITLRMPFVGKTRNMNKRIDILIAGKAGL